jgi:hypothetical protein
LNFMRDESQVECSLLAGVTWYQTFCGKNGHHFLQPRLHLSIGFFKRGPFFFKLYPTGLDLRCGFRWCSPRGPRGHKVNQEHPTSMGNQVVFGRSILKICFANMTTFYNCCNYGTEDFHSQHNKSGSSIKIPNFRLPPNRTPTFEHRLLITTKLDTTSHQ